MAATTSLSLKNIHPRDLKLVVKEVPTLPIVYQQLFSKMSNPNVSVPQLAEIVTKDQSLATKILKLVNSAFYGYKKEITTISRAMVVLGFRTVRNAALAISVFDLFTNGRPMTGRKDLPQVAVKLMVGKPGHWDWVFALVTTGERKSQLLGGRFGVFKEQLVKIPHAKQEQRLAHCRFGLVVLLHHGGRRHGPLLLQVNSGSW